MEQSGPPSPRPSPGTNAEKRPLAAAAAAILLAGAFPFAGGNARGAETAAETAAQRGARLEVDPEEWDFGNAGPGETLEHDFVLKNTGNRELVLGRIASACACAAAVVGTEVLPPGAETLLRVTLETRQYRGILERWLTITSNDRRGAKRVKLRVYIEDRPIAAAARSLESPPPRNAQRPTKSRYAQLAASAVSPAASAALPARNQGGVFRRTSSAPVAASQP